LTLDFSKVAEKANIHIRTTVIYNNLTTSRNEEKRQLTTIKFAKCIQNDVED